MKKLLLTLVLLVGIVFGLFAQKLTYQAVIRDNNQQLVTNTAVTAHVAIIFQDEEPYDEEVSATTNIHGLLSFEFGGDALNGRDWTNAKIAIHVINTNTLEEYVGGEPRPVSAVPYALSVNGTAIQQYLTENHYVTETQVGRQIRDSIANIGASSTTQEHSHSNMAVLSATTASFTVADKSKLDGIETGAEVNVQSDWNQSTTTADDYIKNKPNLATVATSGSYNDLTNKPSIKDTVNDILDTKGYLTTGAIDSLQNAQADWNQTSTTAKDYIKNKPELFSGDYNDLTNKPSIKDTVNNILSTGGYVTADALDGRHYLTSDSTVITTMQNNISTNATNIQTNTTNIANLLLRTAKNAIRDSVAGQIHDSIADLTADSHNHSNKDLLDTYSQTNDDLADAVSKRHAHDNAAVLAATTAPYTDADSLKLKGIADGAEVNVQSDWEQTDANQDDYIKNKPNLATVATSGSYNDLTNKPSISDTVNTILDTKNYLTTHLSKNAIRDSVASQIHDSIAAIGASSTTQQHSHSNMDVLSATTAPFTTANKTTLDSLVTVGAQKNVQADWNQEITTADDYIKNKPTNVSAFTNDAGYLTKDSAAITTLISLLEGLNNKINALQNTVDSQDSIINALNEQVNPFTCGSSKVKDVDNNEYNTVAIGNQCWTRENMKTTKYANGNSIDNSKMYNPNNSEDSVATYGKLYTWSAATRDSSTTYPEAGQVTVQGICPAGWHVPSHAEWDMLTTYVNSKAEYRCQNIGDDIAKALASKTGWNTNEWACSVGDTPEDNNLTGFSAVPAGYCYYYGYFKEFGESAYFWSATQDSIYAYVRFLSNRGTSVASYSTPKNDGYSVRCLRDAGIGGTTPSAPDTMRCEDVMRCLGDTLGRLNAKIEDLNTTVTEQGETITEQGNTIDSLAHIVDSLSNLTPGGGITPLEGEDGQACQGTTTVSDNQGNTYNTVKIGNQCWMQENLRTRLGTAGDYGYPTNVTGDDTVTYGRLYSWAAVMNGADASSDVPSRVQGICPEGWHVPSDSEWGNLINYVISQTNYKCGDDQDNIANALSSETGWTNGSTPGCNAGDNNEKRNKTGFSAVPAGKYTDTAIGTNAYFWSTTKISDIVRYYILGSDSSIVNQGFEFNENMGLSVRCLRN